MEKGNLPYLIIRATCGTLGIICNFYAVDHLVLSNANMLNKISPFFGVLFSYIFLKEKCRPLQALAIAGAFMGSLCIIQPSFSNINTFASLMGFLGGMGAGAAYTAVRYLGKRGENGSVIVFFFSTFSCVVALPWIIFDYHSMSGMQFLYLMLAGLSAAGGQFGITAAYTHAPASEISVYDYSQVIFAAILGFIIFGQLPDSLSILGYFIICTMAVFMFIYNKKDKKGALDEQKD